MVAEVDSKIHALCLDAKDYSGCIRENKNNTAESIQKGSNDSCSSKGGGKKLRKNIFGTFCMNDSEYAEFICTNMPHRSECVESDDVEVAEGFTYRKSTIKQLKIRDRYGRYITFWGRSINDYSGTPGYYNPGSPGSINCSTNSFGSTATTYCNRTGYIAPSYSPGTQGGTQKRWFEYELDCRDRTYNRKGDISAGAFKKGWQDVYYDKTARAVADIYCPKINSLPYANVHLILDPESLDLTIIGNKDKLHNEIDGSEQINLSAEWDVNHLEHFDFIRK